MKVTFKMELVAKGTEKVFDPELGPGILASQEITFDVETGDLKRPQFICALLEQEREFVERLVEVRTTKM